MIVTVTVTRFCSAGEFAQSDSPRYREEASSSSGLSFPSACNAARSQKKNCPALSLRCTPVHIGKARPGFAACPGPLAEGVAEMTPGWDPRDQQPAASLRPAPYRLPTQLWSLEPGIHIMELGTCKIASRTVVSFAALHSASLLTAFSRSFRFYFWATISIITAVFVGGF